MNQFNLFDDPPAPIISKWKSPGLLPMPAKTATPDGVKREIIPDPIILMEKRNRIHEALVQIAKRAKQDGRLLVWQDPSDQRRYNEVLSDLNVAERALYDATNEYRDFRGGTAPMGVAE